jgi:hypothetical protein
VRNHFLSSVLIGAMLVVGPICYFYQTSITISIKQKKALSKNQKLASPIFIEIFLRLPLEIIHFLTVLFSTFFNVIYGGILLYRIPNLLLAMIQIPLRFLHNGNIQRSLMFVSIMLVTYIFWWSSR